MIARYWSLRVCRLEHAGHHVVLRLAVGEGGELTRMLPSWLRISSGLERPCTKRKTLGSIPDGAALCFFLLIPLSVSSLRRSRKE